jgi:hypothetical protein
MKPKLLPAAGKAMSKVIMAESTNCKHSTQELERTAGGQTKEFTRVLHEHTWQPLALAKVKIHANISQGTHHILKHDRCISFVDASSKRSSIQAI